MFDADMIEFVCMDMMKYLYDERRDQHHLSNSGGKNDAEGNLYSLRVKTLASSSTILAFCMCVSVCRHECCLGRFRS